MKRISSCIWQWIENIARQFLIWYYKARNRDLSEESVQTFLQFIKFALVGLSNTVISYVINIIVLLILSGYGLWWDYIAGNTIAFVISVAWSFYWNNKYVFVKEEGQSRSLVLSLLKTYASYAITGIVLSNVLSALWIDYINLSKYIAPLLNLVITVPLNYFLNKLWAFRTSSKQSD